MTTSKFPFPSEDQPADFFNDDSDIDEFISSEDQVDSLHFEDPDRVLTIFQAQEEICQFFLENTLKQSPESTLKEFKNLFFLDQECSDSRINQALNLILLSHNQGIFVNTLKRSCYILINNWCFSRKQDFIRKLLSLFTKISYFQDLSPSSDSVLYQWLRDFFESEDYHSIEIFVSQDGHGKKQAELSHKLENERLLSRQRAYLLRHQSQNQSTEDLELERRESQKIREQFKKELAIYTARFKSESKPEEVTQNPTALGDHVMSLIHKILKKRGHFSQVNLANIFLKQTEGIFYSDFKKSIINYLFFAIEEKTWVKKFKEQLSAEILILYPQYDEKNLDSRLLLRTSNRIIEALTTKNRKDPSTIFTFLAAQGKYLALSLFLLKILLISRHSYLHLENCITYLIRYYQDKSESECEWLLHFLDTLKIILTIYVDDMDYSLVSMETDDASEGENTASKNYRIFSQSKQEY